MDHRIININKQYLMLIEKLKLRLSNQDEFLDVLDEIELFWMKKKQFICEFLKYQKCSYIGGAMYIHFSEYEHKLPLCINNAVIMDEPICKMINMFRLNDVIDENRIIEILICIVDNIIDNKKLINKNNILIVPMRLYYPDISDDINYISNRFTYQSLTEFTNYPIQSNEDLINYSKSVNDVEELNKLVKADYIFTHQKDISKNITEKIVNFCKSSGRIIDSSNPMDIMEALYEFLYGRFCQAIDLIYLSDILNLDLFVFREEVVYYLNLISSNFDRSEEKIHTIIDNTIVSLFVHKELLQKDYKLDDKIINNKKILSIWNKIIARKNEYVNEEKIDLEKLRIVIANEIK